MKIVEKHIRQVYARIFDKEYNRALVYWCKKYDIDIRKLEMKYEEKNASYGGAIEYPLNLFSKASPIERCLIMLDNKASRMVRGHEYENDDDVRDFAGYLFILNKLNQDGNG